ncbi:MAG TPA: DUF3822 family protein [Flavobacteriales bacterium]|nr:DUF3822 family protein [Flavobacteriales bacterium]
MQGKNLFIGFSDHHVLCAEKDAAQNSLLMEKNIAVGYNQAPDKAFFDNFNAHGHQYNVVYCALKQPFFVLVPEVLFDATDTAQFLPGIDLTSQKILTDKIARNGVMCIYPVEIKPYDALVHTYPNVILKHYASVLIDYTVKNGYTEQKTVVTVDMEDNLFYLCISNKTDLLLCNKFAFKAAEDILYFLLYSLEQFELKPTECQLRICGMVLENSASVILLNEYFEDVVLEESELKNSSEFKNQTAFFHQDACV